MIWNRMVCTFLSDHVRQNTKFQRCPSRTRDKMKRILFLISEGVFDAFGNCSDSAYITAFSTIRKSVLYLCVTGNCQNLCIISKCKDGIQSNKRNSQYFPSKYFGILLKWSTFIFVVVIASFSVLFLLSHSLEYSYYRSLVEKQALVF